MSTATTTRSAYPAQVDDLMPQAIELTKSLDGVLPSRNRLMKDLHIGADKAKAVLAELTDLADRDRAMTDMAAYRAARGHLAFRPPLTLVPDAATPTDVTDQANPAVTLREPAEIPLAPAAETAAPAANNTATAPNRRVVTWPVMILCLPAFIAIWGGWVEMGRLTGFGVVKLLPGIVDSFQLNTAITLPIGVETYAAYALYVWLSGRARGDARTFAKRSALASLALGALGQIAYHLMNAWHWTSAPWPITATVACIPVAVLGMGAALAHLMHKH